METKVCIECGTVFPRDNMTLKQWAAVKTCSEPCRRERVNRKSREAYRPAIDRQPWRHDGDPPSPLEPPAHLLSLLARRRLIGALDWPRIVVEV